LGALLSTLIGIIIGAVSGYFGGSIDALLMRIIDMIWIMPTFFVALVVVALLGASIYTVVIIIGLLFWPSTARLMRAEMLSLREREFVSALKLMGMSDLRIVFLELLPNALPCSIANGTLQVASAILLESGVSFLGLGDPTHPTWGFQLSDARVFLREAWWMALFPGIGIFLMTLSIYIMGDAINNILNPRLKTSRR
jgi:peptide/nickel transport system permease protein